MRTKLVTYEYVPADRSIENGFVDSREDYGRECDRSLRILGTISVDNLPSIDPDRRAIVTT